MKISSKNGLHNFRFTVYSSFKKGLEEQESEINNI